MQINNIKTMSLERGADQNPCFCISLWDKIRNKLQRFACPRLPSVAFENNVFIMFTLPHETMHFFVVISKILNPVVSGRRNPRILVLTCFFSILIGDYTSTATDKHHKKEAHPKRPRDEGETQKSETLLWLESY